MPNRQRARGARPLRIAVVASPVTPLRPAQTGGAQSVICDLAVALIRRGHDVLLHCAEGSEVAGVELVMVPTPQTRIRHWLCPAAPNPFQPRA